MRKEEVTGSFLPGMAVYIRDVADVWLEGTVSTVNKSTCAVFLTNQQKTRECRVEDILQRSEQCLETVTSLTDLSPINQASVLGCLHQRFDSGSYYTNAGSTVVAVNPFKNVDNLYTLETVWAYHNDVQDNPHIYNIGNEAYKRLCRGLGHVNQCIIVSGESGSGKTVTAKHLLRYMTVVTNSSHTEQLRSTSLGVCESVEQRILDSNPILEAFGNAVTQRNDNSSRFGKFIQLQFSRGGHMTGAEIQTYLLEKTRVVHQLTGEANFHIFYQIMKSLLESEDTSLGRLVLDMGEDAFKVLPVGKSINTNRELQDTLKAMTEIGISEEMQGEITKILVAILFLCNVEITPLEDELCQLLQETVSETSLKQAAELLGLGTSHMEQVLLYRSIESGGNKRRSVFVKPVPQREAYSRRDCLATLLYSRLFDWLVGFINKQIQGTRYDHNIGLLDIYGFEAFEMNSLEQLCINYANEKLQQHYVKHFLKDLQTEYEEECIDWHHLSYSDNQPCLDILEGQPSVFGLLNEDVQLNRQTDTTHLCERILQLSKSSTYVKRPKCFMKNPSFTVQHFAGDVTYTGAGLTTKNRDNIPQELVCMLRDSKNKFLSELFEAFSTDEQHGRKRKTVLGKFKASLDSLMSSLKSSDVHYIRCIKPNTSSVPQEFDRRYVMSQLMASGIIETVKISSLGYPVRMPYPLFLQRYGLIIRNARSMPQSTTGQVSDSDTLYDPLDALYQKQLNMITTNSPRKSSTPKRRLRRRAGLSSCDHTRRCCAAVLTIQFGTCQGLTQQFGKTKLFLHQDQVDRLEQRRFDILSEKAAILQHAWRRHKTRQDVKKKNASAAKIQLVWKRYRKVKHTKAVILLQKTFRMHIARKRYKDVLHKVRQEKQKKKKSWKPILDRKRTSPGTGRSNRSQRSDGSINTSEESESKNTNVSLEGSSSVDICTNKNDNNLKQFVTSTPQINRKKSLERDDSSLKCKGEKENKENIERVKRNPKGRPDMSKYSPVKQLRSYTKLSASKRTNISMETGGGDQGDQGVSPQKKMKMTDCDRYGSFHLQDGILTRRCLPKMPVRFHTRASVLKYAHYMNQKELPGGLLDCLPDKSFDCPSKLSDQ